MTHGLDWSRMGIARGIAGSSKPEEDGVFLSRTESDVGYFVEMNNTGGPVDVWAVDRIDESLLITSGNGYEYYPAPILPMTYESGRVPVSVGPPSANLRATCAGLVISRPGTVTKLLAMRKSEVQALLRTRTPTSMTTLLGPVIRIEVGTDGQEPLPVVTTTSSPGITRPTRG